MLIAAILATILQLLAMLFWVQHTALEQILSLLLHGMTPEEQKYPQVLHQVESLLIQILVLNSEEVERFTVRTMVSTSVELLILISHSSLVCMIQINVFVSPA